MLLLLFVFVVQLQNNGIEVEVDECMRREGLIEKGELGNGAYGKVTQVCYKGDCGYVIKTGWIYESEIKITKKASEGGVGPYMHKWFECEGRKVMLMDKYPRTLGRYLIEEEVDKEYMGILLLRLFDKVGKLGIRHNDIHKSNIMVGEDIGEYTKKDLEKDDELRPIMLIDYGLSSETYDHAIREEVYMEYLLDLY